MRVLILGITIGIVVSVIVFGMKECQFSSPWYF